MWCVLHYKQVNNASINTDALCYLVYLFIDTRNSSSVNKTVRAWQ